MIKLDFILKNYYKGFLRDFKYITNPDYIKNCPGFIEITEQFLGPCEYVMHWKSLPEVQRKKLQKVYEEVLEYNPGNKADDEIAKDPNWLKICELAKTVYEELKNVKYTSVNGEDSE